MPVSVLGLAVTANATGGALGTGFSATDYKALSATAANYTTDVVYTDTQQ